MGVGALEATLETSNEQVTALESQTASKEAKIVEKMEQANSLEERLWIAEEGASQTSETIHERGLQLRASEAAHFYAGVALQSAKIQTQIICALVSSLREELGLLHSNKTRL